MNKPTDNQVVVELGRLRGMVFFGGDRSKQRNAAVRELEYGISEDELKAMSSPERELAMMARQWKAGKCPTSPSAELLT